MVNDKYTKLDDKYRILYKINIAIRANNKILLVIKELNL